MLAESDAPNPFRGKFGRPQLDPAFDIEKILKQRNEPLLNQDRDELSTDPLEMILRRGTSEKRSFGAVEEAAELNAFELYARLPPRISAKIDARGAFDLKKEARKIALLEESLRCTPPRTEPPKQSESRSWWPWRAPPG
jgi:hypothetical protein